MRQNLCGDASKDKFFKTLAAVRTHHNEIRAHGVGGVKNSPVNGVTLHQQSSNRNATSLKLLLCGIHCKRGLCRCRCEVLALAVGEINPDTSEGIVVDHADDGYRAVKRLGDGKGVFYGVIRGCRAVNRYENVFEHDGLLKIKTAMLRHLLQTRRFPPAFHYL